MNVMGRCLRLLIFGGLLFYSYVTGNYSFTLGASYGYCPRSVLVYYYISLYNTLGVRGPFQQRTLGMGLFPNIMFHVSKSLWFWGHYFIDIVYLCNQIYIIRFSIGEQKSNYREPASWL